MREFKRRLPREKKPRRYNRESYSEAEPRPLEISEFQQPTIGPAEELPPSVERTDRIQSFSSTSLATEDGNGEEDWSMSVSGLSEKEPPVYVLKETPGTNLGIFGIFSAIAKGCINMNPDLNKVNKR